MHPAFSVIFLTTLIGVGQGLFLAIYTGEVYGTINLLPEQSHAFYTTGSVISLLFLAGGLAASFLHLGHPERAWRAASQWRTSWLSREVIVLPAVMGAVLVYGLVHLFGLRLDIIGISTPLHNDLSLLVGAGGTALAFLLYLCTGMIYACIKFLKEWATPLTVINYTLLGLASGFLLASVLAAVMTPELVSFYVGWTIVLVVASLITRGASLIRNARLKPQSNLKTAIGVRHSRIQQRSQGLMGGSFNTREFFHGAPDWFFRSIKWVFIALVFVVPGLMLVISLGQGSVVLLGTAFIIHYLGLIAERWFFFAQANHPQNLYYQTVS
jgi:DMSO reductase anchor subunit